MKLLAATALSLALTAPAFGQEPMIEIARSGSQSSRQGPAENFTGSVRVDPLFAANGPSRASGAYVTFEAGARSAWHTHALGQTLIVTAGSGRVQSWGGPVQEIRPGEGRGSRHEAQGRRPGRRRLPRGFRPYLPELPSGP